MIDDLRRQRKYRKIGKIEKPRHSIWEHESGNLKSRFWKSDIDFDNNEMIGEHIQNISRVRGLYFLECGPVRVRRISTPLCLEARGIDINYHLNTRAQLSQKNYHTLIKLFHKK